MEPMTELTESPNEVFDFPDPTLLDLDEETTDEIVDTIDQLNRRNIQSRQTWSSQHQEFDLMWRGQAGAARDGPWQGSADLHVQMPYWAVDAINTRLVAGIWSQTPLVSGEAEEDDDQEIFTNATDLVDWHLQPKRMSARRAWSTISKMRCIHGTGHGLFAWVKGGYVHRVGQNEGPRVQFNPDGSLQVDENGDFVQAVQRTDVFRRTTAYDGPILTPLEWDDVIYPLNGVNCQPVWERNPQGADYVGIRQWESLSLMTKKAEQSENVPGAYGFMFDGDRNKDWWLSKAPSQDRSGSGGGSTENQQRVRVQDYAEGRNRNQEMRRSATARPNPEFEVMTWFMPWEIEGPDGKEEAECVFFVCLDPRVLLGAYRLSDVYWKNERPIVELHYQTVGTRHESMGVMEVAKHLSAELDTIHNMRMDVGFATNMPFFFFQATSTFDPERIELRPMKGVPVDDVNSVRFPQLQNVTSFYAEEEQLLYSLVERTLGVTDLFLGRSPTQGAAARHATGFVGTQQESLARTSEILNQDAEEFGHLCRLVYNHEIQYGPPERTIRLIGQEGPLGLKTLNRRELWLRGEYDFRLGANEGMYSSFLRQQQTGQLLQSLQFNPFVMQDPGRLWEAWAEIYRSWGYRNVERFIGPKSAVGPGVQKEPDEENGEMVQYAPGSGNTHPNDNDMEHIQAHSTFMGSQEYRALGMPNQQGFMKHLMSHQMQQQQKQAMMAQQQAQGPQGQQVGQQGPALNQERILPQLQGVGDMGAMGTPPSNGNGPPSMPQ